MLFHPQEVDLKFRYFMCFILQNWKIVDFFLEARSNSKLHLLKPNVLLSIMMVVTVVVTMVVVGKS